MLALLGRGCRQSVGRRESRHPGLWLGALGQLQALTNQVAYIIETFPEHRFSDSAEKERRSDFGAPIYQITIANPLDVSPRAACHSVTVQYKKGATGISLDIPTPVPPARDTNACKAIPATAPQHCDTHFRLQHSSVNLCTTYFREIIPLHTAQNDCPQH